MCLIDYVLEGRCVVCRCIHIIFEMFDELPDVQIIVFTKINMLLNLFLLFSHRLIAQ